jgi:hypothetical protein
MSEACASPNTKAFCCHTKRQKVDYIRLVALNKLLSLHRAFPSKATLAYTPPENRGCLGCSGWLSSLILVDIFGST